MVSRKFNFSAFFDNETRFLPLSVEFGLQQKVEIQKSANRCQRFEISDINHFPTKRGI